MTTCIYTFILFLSTFLGYTNSLLAQQRINHKLYHFNKKYLHLGNLAYKDVTGILNNDFKQVSTYHHRFSRLSSNILDYKGSLFYIGVSNSLALKKPDQKDKTILPNAEKKVYNRGANYLLQSSTGILHIKDLEQEAGYQIYKYDEAGTLLFQKQIKHSQKIELSTYTYFKPYLKYKLHTPNFVFFTSYESTIPQTIRLDVSSGKAKLYHFTLAGVLLDEAQDSIVVGYVRFDTHQKQLLVDYLTQNFTIPLPTSSPINSVETLLHQDTLLLVCYHDQMPNNTVLAFDLSTQKIIWQKQLPPKRKLKAPFYFNKVWLSRFHQKIILESYASAGRQLHILDWSNGDILWQD